MQHKIIGRRLLKFFDKIVFDEVSHTYKVTGQNLTPVSNIIKTWVEPFNAKAQSVYSGRKEGVSAEEMQKRWKKISDDACTLGTMVHDFGERYVIDRYGVDSRLEFKDVYQHIKKCNKQTPKEVALIKFWDEKPDYLVPICLELRMFSVELGVAGTADIILLDTRDNTIVIADYKTNKDLYKRFKEKTLLGQFKYLPDTPLSKYQIQLSMYQILLELSDYKVSRRFLIWLKEDGNYEIFDTPNHTKELKQYFYEKENTTSDGWVTIN